MDGLRVAGVCVSSDAAASQYFSAQPRAAQFIPDQFLETVYVPCQLPGSGWCRRTETFNLSGSLVNVVVVPAELPSFQPCDQLESFWDGHVIGWLVFALLVCVGAFMKMSEGAK